MRLTDEQYHGEPCDCGCGTLVRERDAWYDPSGRRYAEPCFMRLDDDARINAQEEAENRGMEERSGT